MELAAAHLLDFSKPFDTALLDQIVVIAMDGLNPQRPAANKFLVDLRENADMWKRADAILETSSEEGSKFFALQVLTEMINTKWKITPPDQREGIRNYIVGKIIYLSRTEEVMRQNRLFLPRLNLVLVQILKQDWPHAWPSFISDIVGSSKISESLCENNMKILKLLSEEVFDFSKDTMTTLKTKTMKESLNEEFSQIFQLCEYILGASGKRSLIIATLETLQRFLTWIPLGFVFETPLIPAVIAKFSTQPEYRSIVVDCLTEVASLPSGDIPEQYHPQMQKMLVDYLCQLTTFIPPHTDVAKVYEHGSEDDRIFVQRLALFLGTYLKSFFSLFSIPDGSFVYPEIVIAALEYMLKVSQVDDEEVFKTCLEFWYHFSKELYSSVTGIPTGGAAMISAGIGGGARLGTLGPQQWMSRRLELLEGVLHKLRIVMIDQMAKPEEVIVVEDENGEIVREMTKDTEVIAQYKTMREAIVYLTHLNYDDTETIMLEKLEVQVSGGGFTWSGLSTLCWAIGSISGAMSETDEKRFLVSVIKDLLKLCEESRGKDNKAVVASNIMYIVGQYPRFLRAHWKFLKTVVNKLFEFMHETHPGVQDMACDTFLKIAQKCKRKFMTPQTEDPEPFVVTLITDIRRHVADLQMHQVLSFYESVGTMLSDSGPSIRLPREEVLGRLMEVPNGIWTQIMTEGSANIETLTQRTDVMKELSRVLRINNKVCASAGCIYAYQLQLVFKDMLAVYSLYSQQINAAIATQGDIAARHVLCKAMRGVKSDILDVFVTFFEASRELQGGPQAVAGQLLPPLMAEVLGDYRTAPASARDAKVLILFATIISVLRDHIVAQVPAILEAVFEPTLEMITRNMLDHPEHRISFFRFLREANEHCFRGLFSIPPQHQKMIVDSVVWAIKHEERNISETGMEILEELLQKVAPYPQIAQSFYQINLLSLIQDVLVVMTDHLHKSGFKQQASILKHIFHIVQTGQVTEPLFDPATHPPTGAGPAVDNAHYLREHVANLLASSFPENLTQSQVFAFVTGLFDVSKDITAFKFHLRDFLIALKEFSSEDNSELFAEEQAASLELQQMQQRTYMASIPGMLKPDELDGDEDF